MSGFERPRKRSPNKDVGENVPCCDIKFYWDYKCIKYFEELVCLFHKVENYILELLQIFESLDVHNAARTQSSILAYFNQK